LAETIALIFRKNGDIFVTAVFRTPSSLYFCLQLVYPVQEDRLKMSVLRIQKSSQEICPPRIPAPNSHITSRSMILKHDKPFYVDPVARGNYASLILTFNLFNELNICTSLKNCKFTNRIFLAPEFRCVIPRPKQRENVIQTRVPGRLASSL
jgi:hypothetical protein